MAHIMPPCESPLTILHVDEHIIVINKPPELLSVPGRLAENFDSAKSRLAQRYGDIHVVHRLDASTSGVMVFARTKAAERKLSIQFQNRVPSKCYRAIVAGLVESAKGSMDMPLIADWPNRPRQKVCYATGKPALTSYKCVATSVPDNCTELLLFPTTGRSHQLRVHCSAIGHPIAGCEFYADKSAFALTPRLMLHAERLGFIHPALNHNISFFSPAPFKIITSKLAIFSS